MKWYTPNKNLRKLRKEPEIVEFPWVLVLFIAVFLSVAVGHYLL